MIIVSIDQAKIKFLKLINQVEKGEEIVITRAGKSVVMLVAYKRRKEIEKCGNIMSL